MEGITKTKKIVGTAIFSALSFVVSLWEIPIFSATPFLKLDFSNAVTLLGGFIYGPLSAVCISLIKELLCLFKSTSGGIGELANFIVTVSFVLFPTLLYKYKKGFKRVVITILIGCLFSVLFSLITNRFLTFPLYVKNNAKEVFYSLWYFIVLFNLIKSFSVSIITILLYKRTSYLIKKI